MSQTERWTEANRPVAKIDPASYNSEQNTARFDMALYNRVVFLIQVGAIASSGTLDAQVEQHDAATGGTTKDVTGKGITQLTADDDNKLVAIEVRSEELDVNNGFHYLSLELTPAVAASIVGVMAIAHQPVYKPIGVTEWDEVVD